MCFYTQKLDHYDILPWLILSRYSVHFLALLWEVVFMQLTHSLLFAISGCIVSVNIQTPLGDFYNVISSKSVLDIFTITLVTCARLQSIFQRLLVLRSVYATLELQGSICILSRFEILNCKDCAFHLAKMIWGTKN